MTQLCVRESGRAKSRDILVSTTVFATELGWMAIAWRDERLLGVVFGHDSPRSASTALRRVVGDTEGLVDVVDVVECPKSICSVVDKLTRYAAGDRIDFSDVEIDEGRLARFGKRVVAACRRIPAGQTRSYGQLAAVCGSPGAARAVGQVMAKNRYPLVVPCHRVVGASGSLGGFSAPRGLATKRRLLAMEADSQ